MAITFQYNKTSLNLLRKQLRMRERALPVLQNKESALRAEVQRYQKALDVACEAREAAQKATEALYPFFARFGFDRLRVEDMQIKHRRIAGVSIPELVGFRLQLQPLLWHAQPAWTADAVRGARELLEAALEERMASEQVRILERERKRTTQKVNLYEKVQIPGMEDGIKRIKRFLEDQENLSKAAQKMVKARLEREAEAEQYADT